MHYTTLHDDIYWNDHYINAGDKDTLLAAKPWVREDFQKRFPQRDVKAWLGSDSENAPAKSGDEKSGEEEVEEAKSSV
jgi:hypothetical protein